MADADPVDEVAEVEPGVGLTIACIKLRIAQCKLKIYDRQIKLAENEGRLCPLKFKLLVSRCCASFIFGTPQELRARIRAVKARSRGIREVISHQTAWLGRLKTLSKEIKSGRVTVRALHPLAPFIDEDDQDDGIHGWPPIAG